MINPLLNGLMAVTDQLDAAAKRHRAAVVAITVHLARQETVATESTLRRALALSGQPAPAALPAKTVKPRRRRSTTPKAES